MMRFTLDTCVVISAEQATDVDHGAALELLQLAEDGQVGLAIVRTAFNYDQEKGKVVDPERADRLVRWLAEHPYVREVPGQCTLGVSRLDSGDVL